MKHCVESRPNNQGTPTGYSNLFIPECFGKTTGIAVCLLGIALAITSVFLMAKILRPLEAVIQDTGIVWRLKEVYRRGQGEVLLVFSSQDGGEFLSLRHSSGFYGTQSGCFVRKGRKPISDGDLEADPNILKIIPGSGLEQGLLRIIACSLRKEIQSSPSFAVYERIGAILIVNDLLKLPNLDLRDAGSVSVDMLTSLPPDILEKRLYGSSDETKAMMKLIREKYSN